MKGELNREECKPNAGGNAGTGLPSPTEEKFVREFCERWADFKGNGSTPQVIFGRLARYIRAKDTLSETAAICQLDGCLALRNAAPQVGAEGQPGSIPPVGPAVAALPDDKQRIACVYRTGCETPNDCREHGCCRSPKIRSGDGDAKSPTPRCDAKPLCEPWDGLARQLERELIVAQGLEHMAYDQRDRAFDELNAVRSATALPDVRKLLLDVKCELQRLNMGAPVSRGHVDALIDRLTAAASHTPPEVRKPTIQELEAKLAAIQMELHHRVLGDPSRGVTMSPQRFDQEKPCK